MSSVSERLVKIVNYSNLNYKEFSKKISISPVTFNNYVNNDRIPDSKILTKIKQSFNSISIDWLLTGDGEMLKSEVENKKNTNLIPLYEDVTSIGGRNYVSEMNGISKSTEMIDAGDWFPGVTAAIRHYGDSMTEYPSGCILALRKINDRTEFSPGKNYVVETYDDRVTKRMQLSNKEGYATLYSSNTETYPDGRLRYEPYPVKLNNITGLFLVLGRIVKEHSSGPVFTQ